MTYATCFMIYYIVTRGSFLEIICFKKYMIFTFQLLSDVKTRSFGLIWKCIYISTSSQFGAPLQTVSCLLSSR